MPLEELRIRDLGVIEEVSLDLAAGLNVLTGETGAGKTMVVSALQLLLGARADADQVRAGARRAVVEGRFHPPPPAAGQWLADGDDELVASRLVAADGQATRSRARLGGHLAPVSALAEALADAVEVHGQADTARLARAGSQRELLDRFGGAETAAALAAYRSAFHAWRQAQAEVAEQRSDARDRAREADRLSFELAEIDAVDPRPGEEQRLEAELRRLEHAEALLAATRNAAAAITDDGAARDALGAALAALRAVAGIDEGLDGLAARAEALAAEAQDLALELSGYADRVDLDPARLEQMRERRAALAGLARKYGPDAAAVVAYAERCRTRLHTLEGGEGRAARLEAELPRLQAALDDASGRLRAARAGAGRALATRVRGHLAELAMPGARMEVAVEATDPGPDGADRVAFLLAANPGEPALPLAKAASGGERSRVALALRLALADADATGVVVFDEVDAGIGGAVALEVGRKLARLARGGRQVLCVTHLPQIAAFADAHFVVAKRADRSGRSVATVERLEEQERLTELSRMLAGRPDSELAAGHAAELRAAAVSAAEDDSPAPGGSPPDSRWRVGGGL